MVDRKTKVRNHEILVEMWNEKTKYPHEGYIELATFRNALIFLEENGWFSHYEE